MATPSETTTALLRLVSEMQQSITTINQNQSSVVESLNKALSSSYYRHEHIRAHFDQINRYNTNVDRTIRLIEMIFDLLILQSVPRQPRNIPHTGTSTTSSSSTTPPNIYFSRTPTTTPTTDTTISQLLAQLLISDSSMIEIQYPTGTLTDDQINQYTELIEYHSSDIMTEPRCPITYEDFIEGEQVIRIRHCRHYFKDRSLVDWLHLYSICPVCRHNLCT